MRIETNLIDQLKRGHEESFRLVFANNKDLVFNTALHLLQNEEDAMDVLQEVFLTVFESIGQFDHRSAISTWIYRICINKSLNQLRRRKLRNFSFFSEKSGQSTPNGIHWVHPGVILEQKEKARRLYAAIAKLKSKERVSFTLFHIQGLTQKEIAEATEQSVSAVETQIFRAKQNLSEWLIDEKL